MKSLINYINEGRKPLDVEQCVNDSVSGEEHGFDYVDLGLPSGTMWATCNVGADKPEDPGLLFQFGRVDGYAYGDTNNKFTKEDENENMTGYKYINPTTSRTEYYEDDILNLKDDAAHVNMGGKWIMPTKADLEELYDNTTRKVMTINGKKGMLLTSNINGKSIFVVFSGYWCCYNNTFSGSGSFGYLRASSVGSSDYNSLVLDFNTYGDFYIADASLVDAYSVRGVFKK